MLEAIVLITRHHEVLGVIAQLQDLDEVKEAVGVGETLTYSR